MYDDGLIDKDWWGMRCTAVVKTGVMISLRFDVDILVDCENECLVANTTLLRMFGILKVRFVALHD